MEILVSDFSENRETILDPFVGSGTTLAVRTPGPVRTRPIYAALRLKAPFLVEISV